MDLFHEDSYIKAFEAAVLSQEKIGEGLYRVCLSDTAFYPGGGGQPVDHGFLNGRKVVDIRQEREGAPIFHDVETGEPLPAKVHGAIDFQRRYDHMQQHSGQHLLSYAMAQVFGGHSLGLHIGEKDSYVDVRLNKGRQVDEDAWRKVLDKVEEMIASHLAVRQYFPTGEEMKALSLRKEPDAHEHLRIVEIGPESVACCGTHVGNTSEIRLVTILRTQQSHGNLRVVFLAGNRAIQHARLCVSQAMGAGAALSCHISELTQMVERLKEQGKEQGRELAVLKKQQALAELLKEEPRQINGRQALIKAVRGLEARQMQDVVSDLFKQGIEIVCLALQTQDGYTAVLGREEDLPLDAGKAFRALCDEFSGKGGGRPDFAQGRFACFDEEKAMEIIQRCL